MKVVILAGGFGTRFSEQTELMPKPMIDVGEKPIIWHIMKIYSQYGFDDFIICCGYKAYYIKEWFSNYCVHNNDITCHLGSNTSLFHNSHNEDWKVTLIDTGLNTMTGGRIKRIQEHVGNETFMATYGDGVGDVNIDKLLDFHYKHGKAATLTAVYPEGRFGALGLKDTKVEKFGEKTDTVSRINAGFFVLEPEVFDYIDGDEDVFEKKALVSLANDGKLQAYFHDGFWKPMDKQVDKKDLDKLWDTGNAPWKTWEDHKCLPKKVYKKPNLKSGEKRK